MYKNSPPNLLDEFADNTPTFPDTFMNFELGDKALPAKLLLFGQDFHVYETLDLILLSTMALKLKFQVVKQWLTRGTRGLHEFGHFESPRVPTKKSPVALERERDDDYKEYKDNSFGFEAHDSEVEDQQQHEQNLEMRHLLEAEDEKVETSNNQKGPFLHPFAEHNELGDRDGQHYLEVLGSLVDNYRNWVEGYEVSWSPRRKQREDQMTNFGCYLSQMNEQIQQLIDRLLGNGDSSKSLRNTMKQKTIKRGKKFAKGMEKPNLKAFLTCVNFDWGRSSSTLEGMIANVTDALGDTAEERRHNRRHFNGSEFSMFQDMRDYMMIQSEIGADPDKYALILRELTSEWHITLLSFHKNITQHYSSYLKTHSRSSQNQFLMKPMDVIDMKDPANSQFLSSYDSFHKTEASEYIKVSQGVGKSQPKGGWGGLDGFTLPDSLLNEARKDPELNKDKMLRAMERTGKTANNYAHDQEIGFDRSVSLEQFAILHQHIDSLYLHDFSLPGQCNRLFHEKALYDKDQKIQIPSVIASYDLFQRMDAGGYSHA